VLWWHLIWISAGKSNILVPFIFSVLLDKCRAGNFSYASTVFLHILSSLLSQIIIPFNTVWRGLVKASLNKPRRLHGLLEVRSTKPCSSRSWRCYWLRHFCFGLPSVRRPLGWYWWASGGRPSFSASSSSSFSCLSTLFILPPFVTYFPPFYFFFSSSIFKILNPQLYVRRSESNGICPECSSSVI